MPAAPSARRMGRKLAVGSIGFAAAAISARALLRPLPNRERKLLDWSEVSRVANLRTGEGSVPPLEMENASARYDELAHEVAPWMAEVLETELIAYPAFRALTRREFIDANLGTIRRLIAPLEELRGQVPENRLTLLGRRAGDRYMGELLGLLSARVLGQYDPVLSLGNELPADLPAPALYLVEPNLHDFETGQHVDGTELRRWIILHELTHAWQFGDHPWLRAHLNGIVRSLLSAGIETRPDGSVRLASNKTLIARMPSLMGEQLRTISGVQALMSVLEGYSNFLMNRVGRKRIREFDSLETAFQQRKQHRPPVERIVFALTGMRFKLRQYEVGERFCTEVARRSSLTTLNRVWESSDRMPTGAELRDPELWLRRNG